MNVQYLASTRGTIPFVRELTQLTGSIVGALLMQQLDFYFKSCPNGFFKFQKPAPKHPAYRPGDSWCEELWATPDEFRNAFDKIGIRYKNRKLFEEAGPDPFQGKFYASFVDLRSNLTVYVRNHAVTDKAIQDLFTVPKVDYQTSVSVPSMVPGTHTPNDASYEVILPSVAAKNRSRSIPVVKTEVAQQPNVAQTNQTAKVAAPREVISPQADAPLDGMGHEGLGSLIFPALTSAEIDEIKKAILKCPAEYRQQVLDEVEGQRTTSTGFRKSAIAFARHLIDAVDQDTFRVDVGARVRDDREKRLASEQIQAASRAENRPAVPAVSDIPLTNYNPKMKDLVSSISQRGKKSEAPRPAMDDGHCVPV
jgi:hypothetical protein